MLNKTAQQRGLEEYADAIQKVAYVHNVDPRELDSFLTGQTMEKNAQNDYANSLMKVANAYNVDPYALDEALTKEANPLAALGEMAPELLESAQGAGNEFLQGIQRQRALGGGALDRAGVAVNDLGAKIKDIIPGMEGATYSNANKAMGLGATGTGAAGTGGLLAVLKNKLRG